MQTYKIRLVSQTNAIVVILLSLAAFMSCAGIFFPNGLHNTTVSVLLAICTLTGVCILWQIFVVGISLWKLDEEEISISWQKKFFGTAGADITIKWREISKIRQGLDTNYYDLVIDLENGETLRFYHGSIFSDDFQDCLAKLYQIFNEKKAQVGNRQGANN